MPEPGYSLAKGRRGAGGARKALTLAEIEKFVTENLDVNIRHQSGKLFTAKWVKSRGVIDLTVEVPKKYPLMQTNWTLVLDSFTPAGKYGFSFTWKNPDKKYAYVRILTEKQYNTITEQGLLDDFLTLENEKTWNAKEQKWEKGYWNFGVDAGEEYDPRGRNLDPYGLTWTDEQIKRFCALSSPARQTAIGSEIINHDAVTKKCEYHDMEIKTTEEDVTDRVVVDLTGDREALVARNAGVKRDGEGGTGAGAGPSKTACGGPSRGGLRRFLDKVVDVGVADTVTSGRYSMNIASGPLLPTGYAMHVQMRLSERTMVSEAFRDQFCSICIEPFTDEANHQQEVRSAKLKTRAGLQFTCPHQHHCLDCDEQLTGPGCPTCRAPKREMP